MRAEVLGYQMSPESSRESERLKGYSDAKLQLYSFQLSGLSLPTPGAERLKYVLLPCFFIIILLIIPINIQSENK